MRKSWYVVKSINSMFGAGRKPERIAEGLNKKEATKIMNKYKRESDDTVSYWIDFDWR